MLNERNKYWTGHTSNMLTCFAFLGNSSCLMPNLFMMKTVETKRSWKMLKVFPSEVKQQIDLSHLTSKLVGYIMHPWRLAMKGNYPSNCMIAMGETAIWSKTVRKTTSNASWGSVKDIPLKSTGFEKVRVSVGWNENETIRSFSLC